MLNKDELDAINGFTRGIKERLDVIGEAAMSLEKSSQYKYAAQKNLERNKIFLRGYVINSDICSMLKESDYTDYSHEKLREIILKYQENSNIKLDNYINALDLYDKIDELEEYVDTKMDYIANLLAKYSSHVIKVFNADSESFRFIYGDIKNDLIKLNDNNLIILLNDLFNYLVNGYPQIDDKFIFKKEGNS